MKRTNIAMTLALSIASTHAAMEPGKGFRFDMGRGQ